MNIEDLGRGRKAIWVRGYTDGIGNIDFFNRYRDTEELNCLLKDQIYLMEENDFRLDVPELNQPKPVVPQFVADWYENNKDRLEEAICSLVWLIGRFGSVTDIEHWFTKTENAIQTLINMHQFGYTVEKEKLYTVEIPNPNEGQLSFVLMRQPGGNVRIKVMHSSNLDLLKTDNDLQLTEAEIKKDFDWAWQWKKEVTGMSLFDEVKELGDESHEKWFNRHFDKYNIEAKIKKSAMKGYNAYRINIEKEPDKYLVKRLGDKRTIDLLKNRLGEGFEVKLSEIKSTYTIFGNHIILDRFILISWG